MRLGRRMLSWLSANWAVVLLLGNSRLHAQAPGHRVINLRTEAARQATVELLRKQSLEAKQSAEALARRRGWPIRGQTQGRQFELMAVVDGWPRYYITDNLNAAISTAADRIRRTAPYDVDGTGYTIGIWDGGAVRPTHQEFGARVSIMDGAGIIDHATHVGGTIGAAGLLPDAQGMAPGVTIHSYEWTSDLAEMATRAATGPGQDGRIQLSNHSYGYVTGWANGTWSGITNSAPHWIGVAGERESRWFGQYSEVAAAWDALHYDAPYYLAFKAAGNDRSDAAPAAGTTYYYYNGGWRSKAYNPATDPLADGWDQGGYDTMEEQACAKNIMTVGAVYDAVSQGARDPSAGLMAPFSNWGPTDDGRIKPDIVANGIYLLSSVGVGDGSYGYMSGTSMATPNASGTAVLLLEYFGRLFPGQAMRASTLKGLILHTADDLGTAGPDYAFGWGLMNAEAAANQIQAHADAPFSLYLHEGLLDSAHPSESFLFLWDGADPIRATLCWTDPAGPQKTALDDRAAVLVNDLDLRMAGPGGVPMYYPYVLDVNNPAAAATTGDNVVDNVEQVLIAAPEAGRYTLTVGHKGTLAGGQQYYSLILSGQSFDPAPTVTLSLSGSPMAESGGEAVVTATLSEVAARPVTVNLSFSGTATFAGDYTVPGTSITIPAATLSESITLVAAADTLDEADETIVVDIDSVENGTENGVQQVTATITDDDEPPAVTLSLDGDPIAENAGTATLTATLSAVSGRPVTVNLAFSGTAVPTNDYTIAEPSVVIAAGELSGSVTLTAVPDAIYEGDETVVVDIDSVVNGTEAEPQQVTATITDDDPQLTVAPASQDFGSVAVGATAHRFFVVQNTGAGTLSGNASVPGPFAVILGSVYSLAPGQSQIVTVEYSPTADGAHSQDVTFTGAGGASGPVTGLALPDSDADGMPDSFETANGLDPDDATDAALDSDGDGFTNVQEWTAGTDPQDAASALLMTVMGTTEIEVQLQFNSVPGKFYRVEYSDTSPAGPWSAFVPQIIDGTGGMIQIQDGTPPAGPTRIYRVVVAP